MVGASAITDPGAVASLAPVAVPARATSTPSVSSRISRSPNRRAWPAGIRFRPSGPTTTVPLVLMSVA
jgi:hypothetical protein